MFDSGRQRGSEKLAVLKSIWVRKKEEEGKKKKKNEKAGIIVITIATVAGGR